jgi:hypothetical protein
LTPPISSRRWAVLVELSVMKQRYQAVLAVIQDGWKVTEVASRARDVTGEIAARKVLAQRLWQPDELLVGSEGWLEQ